MSDMNFLVIDDDEVFSGILARGLTRRGFTVAEAHNADEAIKLANQQKFGQITVDLHLGNDSGLNLVAPLRELQPDARMLVLTGYASIATAVQAVKARHAARQGQGGDELPPQDVAAGQLLRKVLVDLALAASGSDATRKIAQGGVRVDGETVSDINAVVEAGTWTIQAGKKLVVRIRAS